ncbi:MAG: hypothetical protein ACOYBC_03260 [Bilifractor sp.]|jgi:hypothetical protein
MNQEKHENKKYANILWIFVILFLVASSFLITWYDKLPVRDGIFHAAYQIFCMLIPGYTLLTAIGYQEASEYEKVGLGYALGYCFSILTYLISIPFSYFSDGWMSLIPIWNYIIAGVSVVFLIYFRVRGKLQVKAGSRGDLIFFLVFFFAVFVVRLLCFTLPNGLPGNGSEQTYYEDLLYWIGNAGSLSRGFPPESLRGMGGILHYHYFTSMQLAVLEHSTGISIPALGFGYSVIQSTMLAVFGCISLFSYLFKKKWKIIMAAIYAIFVTGDYTQTANYSIFHQVIGPFGFDIGFAFCLFGILLLLRQYFSRDFSVKNGILYELILVITIGCKAPVGVLLLLFQGVLCLYWLIKKKNIRAVMIFAVISLLLFFFVYFAFMSSATGSWSASAQSGEEETKHAVLSWSGTSHYARVLREWYTSDAKALPIAGRILLAVRIILEYLFYTNMGIVICDAISLIHMIAHRKRSDALQWICLLVMACGTAMALLLNFVGNSQVYFIESASPYMIILAFYDTEADRTAEKNRLGIVHYFKICFGIPLMIVGLFFSYSLCQPVVSDAFYRIQTGKVRITSFASRHYVDNIVTQEEGECYNWIRENLDSDAVFISNVTLYSPGSLKTNALTQRRMYIESPSNATVDEKTAQSRYFQVKGFMKGSYTSRRLLKENGVDYVIILKRYRTGEECTKGLKQVYDNDDVTVYRLK